MDYKILLLVVGVAGLFYLLFKFGIPYLKPIKINFEYGKLLDALYALSLAIGDDDDDVISEKVYFILLDVITYAEDYEGIIDLEELLAFTIDQLKIFDIEVNDDELNILEISCDIIISFVEYLITTEI